MNRDIKFRAWDKENNYMVNDFTLNSNGTIDRDWYINLMQYTGLKDKNGKEVYEGDIIGFHDFDSDKYKIKQIYWDQDFCGFNICYDLSELGLKSENIKRIGNIYENPELLK